MANLIQASADQYTNALNSIINQSAASTQGVLGAATARQQALQSRYEATTPGLVARNSAAVEGSQVNLGDLADYNNKIKWTNQTVSNKYWGHPDNPNFVQNKLVHVKWGNTDNLISKHVVKDYVGFLNSLSKIYNIKSVSTYANRDIRGVSGTKSEHAYGLAFDINPSSNPMLVGRKVTNLPVKRVENLLDKYHLTWGYNWNTRPDPMHFQFRAV